MSVTQLVSGDDRHAGHHVEFYEDEHFVFDAAAELFTDGLKAGQPLVLISTPDHRDGITQSLASQGFDLPAVVASGRFTWLDARETLSQFMIEGMPDAALFRTCMGEVLEQSRAGREHLTIRAFGEMVDLLLLDGNPEAALRVEELWNELGHVYDFSLFCAYSVGNLYREDHWRFFHRICDQHVELPRERIAGICQAREFALSSQHVPPSTVRDLAFGKALLSASEIVHFSDCDVCSELWWRLKQSAKPHIQKLRKNT